MQTLIVVCLLKVNCLPRYHPNDWLRRNARLSDLSVSVTRHHHPITSNHHHLHQAKLGDEIEKKASRTNSRGKSEWPLTRGVGLNFGMTFLESSVHKTCYIKTR